MIAEGQLLWWWNSALHGGIWELMSIAVVKADSAFVILENGNGRRQLARVDLIEAQQGFQYTTPAELVPAYTMDARRPCHRQQRLPLVAS